MNQLSSFSNTELFSHCQEDEVLSMEMFSELVDRLYTGRCEYKRLLPGDSIGIQSKSHWAGIVIGLRQFCPSKRLYRTIEQIEEDLELWSRKNGCWMSECDIREDSDCKAMFSRGTESVVYVSKDRTQVLKLMHPREGYEVESLNEMLDCLALYNRVFHSTAYTVVGYGRNDAGILCCVLKQPLVKGRTINKFCQDSGLDETYIASSLDAVMLQLGFQKDNEHWQKDQYLVSDITGSNIVILPNGVTVVIDADVNYKDESYFGKDYIR